jgi:tyrosyl-tRNA synthetase
LNAERYKEQASIFLDFEGENKAILRYNSEWLSDMKFEDVISLASSFTVQDMMKRDMFRRRIVKEKPIYVHEFMYPLMQGYDSVAMNVDGEIGGNDQTFNMLAGRTLMKKSLGKNKFVISLKLLVDSVGKKMGKTEGNMVTLMDTPEDMYGKIMSWSDDLILPGFELCTHEPISSIEGMKKDMSKGENPKVFKMKLARSITTLLHSEDKAEIAEKAFKDTFSEGGIPEDIESVEVSSGSELAEVLLKKGYIDSKGDFRRLVDQGAITNLVTETKILAYDEKVVGACTLKIGKKRFIRLDVK